MAYETLELENHGAVRRILLAREGQRNAQNQQMLDELDDAFAQAAQDSSVNVVVLGGKGAHFSAGHDLKQAQAERSNFTVEQRWAYEGRRYFEPTENGLEKRIKERLDHWRALFEESQKADS